MTCVTEMFSATLLLPARAMPPPENFRFKNLLFDPPLHRETRRKSEPVIDVVFGVWVNRQGYAPAPPTKKSVEVGLWALGCRTRESIAGLRSVSRRLNRHQRGIVCDLIQSEWAVPCTIVKIDGFGSSTKIGRTSSGSPPRVSLSTECGRHSPAGGPKISIPGFAEHHIPHGSVGDRR